MGYSEIVGLFIIVLRKSEYGSYTSQVSFGLDFNFLSSKIKLNEHHSNLLYCRSYLVSIHGHTVHPIAGYVPDPVDQIPLLPWRKRLPDIFTKFTSAWSSREIH